MVRRKRFGFAAALALVVVLAGCSARAPAYESEVAALGDIRDVVPAVGAVQPVVQVEVRAEVSGRVTAVYVAPNAVVRAGQPLARLKPDRAQLSVDGARADVAAAEAGVRQAQSRAEQASRDLANRKRLADRGFLSGGVLANAETAAAEAQAAVERARAEATGAGARLRAASIGMEDVVLRAPRDGLVLDQGVEVGALVGPSTVDPLFVIVSDSARMRVRALVAEPDIGRVSPGMAATFTVEAHPGRTFRGVVVDVLRAPVRERSFVSYPVVVDVDNADAALFPGMTATVEFIQTDVRNVLRSPLSALYFTPEGYVPTLAEPVLRRLRRLGLDEDRDALLGAEVGGLFARGRRRLFVLTPNGPEAREVRIGAETSTMVEVAEGLKPGERVITGAAGDRRAPDQAG
jgi:HlyD family secretion protein